MARPQLHTTETMLDAARELLLEEGAQGATVEAIAAASGAPIGTIYHRFSSRDELVARLWIRAVHRSQASFLAALERSDPKDAAIAAALSILDFCDQEPADARLLIVFRREDVIRSQPGPDLAEELESLNRPVERAVVELAKRLYGGRGRAALDRILMAVFDLPYGAARRYLIIGRPLPRGLRDDLTAAVSALIERPLGQAAATKGEA